MSGTEQVQRNRSERACLGVIIYDGVEPIDIGGTIGVISMARRIVPGLSSATIAAQVGPVTLAGGLVVLADQSFAEHDPCDRLIVCGGPGWRDQVSDPLMIGFLKRQRAGSVASVCTGAMILAAAGGLDGRVATTRRHAVGQEAIAPLDGLRDYGSGIEGLPAAVVDDGGVVTGGGVSLAIDCTL